MKRPKNEGKPFDLCLLFMTFFPINSTFSCKKFFQNLRKWIDQKCNRGYSPNLMDFIILLKLIFFIFSPTKMSSLPNSPAEYPFPFPLSKFSSKNIKFPQATEIFDFCGVKMGRFLQGRFRFAILAIATGCLSMMLANILCLNFTILCITEEQFRWQKFNANLGFEIFENVDFEANRTNSQSKMPLKASSNISNIPNIPGINFPTFVFNWQSFDLARHNPQLFIRLLKMVALELAELTAKRVGEEFDPSNVDFGAFREGFNLTNFDGEVLIGIKKYIFKHRTKLNNWKEIIEKGQLKDIELENITWNGEINGRIKLIEKKADHYYSPGQKALLFGVIAVGALLAIPLVSIGIERLGCRKTFTIVSLISAISTALCPPSAHFGFIPFLIVRLVQGVGFAACFPVIGAVTSAWARLTENGLFNGALTSFIQLAPVITMPLSGTICATIGWQFAYYAHSMITFVLIALWWTIYRDTASEHKKVQMVELRLIQEGKVLDGRNKHNKLPFKAICMDVSVWAIWVTAVGNMYSIQMMIMFSPTYIRQILHYTILNVGFAAAIPTLIQFIVKMIAGIASDRLNLNETFKVRLFNSFAFCGMACFMLALAFTPSQHYRIALLFIILCVTVLGFNTGGFFKSATLIGRQYAYFIGAKIQVIMCIAMLTVPIFVYALTPNNTADEWSIVFISHALLLLLANAIFCLIGSGKAASFTKISGDPIPCGDAQIKDEQTKPIIFNGNGHENVVNGNNINI